MRKIHDAWRQLLPRGVEISGGPPIDNAPALKQAEEKSAVGMSGARKLEFNMGRAYARSALSKLGVHDADLPMGGDRAPVWPEGLTGSITHAAGPQGGYFPAAEIGRAHV